MGLILWQGHYPTADNIANSIEFSLKQNPPDEFDGYYTSFFSDPDSRPEAHMNPLYSSILERVMKDLHLYDRCKYAYSYWAQLYPPQVAGHGYHDHFSGQEVLSWVHFVRSGSKSFNFMTGDGPVYPEAQNDGDFIVFPSWALHSASINNSDTDRLVIAGNIMLEYLEVNYEDGSSSQTHATRRKDETHWISKILGPV